MALLWINLTVLATGISFFVVVTWQFLEFLLASHLWSMVMKVIYREIRYFHSKLIYFFKGLLLRNLLCHFWMPACIYREGFSIKKESKSHPEEVHTRRGLLSISKWENKFWINAFTRWDRHTCRESAKICETNIQINDVLICVNAMNV